MKKGILYGVGTGPGDPELMTVRAISTIKKCHIIAVQSSAPGSSAAYRTASAMIPGLADRECLALGTPMTKDTAVLDAAYTRAAEDIASRLDRGMDVAYLVLGDPAVYSTYIYIHRIIRSMGYTAEMISGVTSFCAAAARLGDSLADRSEDLHIIPSSYYTAAALSLSGTKVFMKAASRIRVLKQELAEAGLSGAMVENCGMPNERTYECIDDIPDDAGYFSVIIVREAPQPMPCEAHPSDT